MLLLGGIILFTSIFAFTCEYKDHRQDFVNKEKQITYTSIPYYNLEYNLQHNIDEYKRLEKEQIRNRKKFFPVSLLVMTGIGICKYFYYWEIKFIGVLLIIYGCRMLWSIFINSDLNLAMRLSSLFSINTVSKKKEKLMCYIHKIEKEIDNQIK